MNVLGLFSGIGGWELGLQRAGMRIAALCEASPKSRSVLRRHFSNTPIYADVKSLRGQPGAVDVICGGFPCQPHSSAARGRISGTADDRWLWPEMLRLVSEIRPAWVCAENVTHLEGVALGQVAAGLEGLGYETETLEIPACAVGHDHLRKRLWILGYTDRHGQPGMPIDDEVVGLSWRGGLAGELGETDGVPTRMDQLAMLGDALIADIAEQIGRAIVSSKS